MSKYEVNYSQEEDYYNKVELQIKLTVKPSAEDSALIQSAIETLEDIADKYLFQKNPVVAVPKKELKTKD